jgi:hypothetical protein
MTTPAQGQPADRLGGVAWMALGLSMLAGAWQMDRFESMGATLYTAPGLVPGAYGLLMLLLGAVLSWRARRLVEPERSAPALLNRRVLIMLALSLAYAAIGVARLPFGPLTAVFVAAFCWTYDERPEQGRRAIAAVVAGVCTAVVVVLVFERVFLVRLP